MNRKLLFVLFGLVLAVLTLLLVILPNSRFRFVKTEPGNNQQLFSSTQNVIFYFNKDMAPNYTPQGEKDPTAPQNLIKINPYVFGTTKVDGKKVTFVPNGLAPFEFNKKYTATLTNIKSQKGQTLPDKSITFTVVYTPLTSLPKSLQEQQASQTDKYKDANTPRNQFIKSLPYTTPGYNIEYIEAQDYFLIRVTKSLVADNKAAALKYMADHSIDTKRERIDFFVLRGLQ
jgi:hypothetical protein